jgi:putative ABC transport system permease protein
VGSVLQDVKFALRRLRLSPGFTLFAVLSLALGVGVSTAIYSAVRTLLWMPMGIADSERTVVWTRMGRAQTTMSWPDFVDMRAQQGSFTAVAAVRMRPATFAMAGVAESVLAEGVSGEYFETLGLTPLQGRLLQRDDEARAARVVVVSERFWRTHLGADSSIVNRAVTISGESFEVVGIVRAPFHGVQPFLPVAMWIPETATPDVARIGSPVRQRANRSLPVYSVWAHLKPAVSVAQAAAEADIVARRLDAAFPIKPAFDLSARAASPRIWALSGGGDAMGGSDRVDALGLVILLAVTAVLLIACTNLANLAKGTSRSQETAVRTALGASRSRLIREQLTESAIVTAAGGILGVLLLGALARLFETDLPIAANFTIHFTPEVDGAVLMASAGATLAALLVCGLWPAWQSTRADLRQTLGTGALSTPAKWRLHRNLIAWQVAGSVAMVLVALMCARVVGAMSGRDPGVDYRHLAVAQVNFAVNGDDEARSRALLDQIVADVRRQPGVMSISVSAGLPFGVMAPSVVITPTEQPFTALRDVGEYTQRISATPEIFATLGMSIVRGRAFTDRDDAASPRVVILSEGIARAVFKTTDIVGRSVMLNLWQRLQQGAVPETCTIVGISKDTDTFMLGRRGNPVLFVPFAQHYDAGLVVSVRSSNPTRGAAQLGTALRRADPQLAASSIGTGSTVLAGPLFLLRIVTSLAAGLGSMALVLAMVGLYGVLSHVVARRTREIGIRLAIGADRRQIFGLILGDGVRPVLMGLLIGLFAGLLMRLVLRATIVTGISPFDATVFLIVPIPFAFAALAACYVPAARASRVDPNVALRDL